ncbi:hypothetical protein D5266_09335, partial [bacterium c-19]|nr:hypothetical protein [bacterium c-19]
DLNIKWKDPNNESKWIVINGDRDNDGIPDLNIDSDGDGKPDLNIDTDHDGKPDLNLVILKKSDWKPTKCVKQDIENGILEEYCTGTSVKAIINIDTDNDGISDINIDNKGDFKPHLNISKDGKTPFVNIVKLHEWKPKKDYKANTFSYDSIGEEDAKRETNIDTDGDGLPDVNVDLDGDGIADINIDSNGDEIPDLNIDSDGDGKPDYNIDISGNGYPEENIIELKEWKPTQNAQSPYLYDTMEIPDPTDPTDTKKPNDPKDTDVKGAYYPGNTDNSHQYAIGGALTGDYTDKYIYYTTIFTSLGIVSLLIYNKVMHKQD